MSTQEITRDDVVGFFENWGQSAPHGNHLYGFVDWTWDMRQETLSELTDQNDDSIIDEIVYSLQQTEEHHDTDKTEVSKASQEYLDDYRAELVDAIRESLS